MDSLAKQYIKNAKALFPLMGKDEKQYFKKLQINIEDYCETKSVSSIEELYNDFGSPIDIVNTYFSSSKIDYILNQIRRTKIIKTTLIVLIVSALVGVTAYCTLVYSAYQVFKAEQIFFEDTSMN